MKVKKGLDAGSQRVTSVATPTSSGDAAPKWYVDAGGPTVWVLDLAGTRPTTGGPTGSGVQTGDIILRRPT